MNTKFRAIVPGLFLVAACGGGSTTPPKDMAHASTVDMAGSGTDDGGGLMIACDPTKQDCTDATNSKCAEVDDGTMMNILVPMCVAPSGTKKEGEGCKRVNMMIGVDDCATGYCSGYGSLNATTPNRHCRTFCNTDVDCKLPNHKCMSFDTTYGWGICIPTCKQFGTDCSAGYDCSTSLFDNDGMGMMYNQTYGLSCRTPGKVAVGMPCAMGDSDCVAGAVCNGFAMDTAGMAAPVCVALCDSTHACTGGKTCKQSFMFPYKDSMMMTQMATVNVTLATGGGWCL